MNGVMLSRGLARWWLLALVPTGVMLSLKGARAAAPLSPAALLLDAVGAPDSLAAIGRAAIGRAAAVAGGDAGLPRTADEVVPAIIERHAALAARLHDRHAAAGARRGLLPAAVALRPAHRQQTGLRGIVALLVARHRPVQQDADGDELEDEKDSIDHASCRSFRGYASTVLRVTNSAATARRPMTESTTFGGAGYA